MNQTEALLLVEYPAPDICLLKLNRANKRNAMNVAMRWQIHSALKAAAKNTDIRVIIFAAAGQMFSAGADLKQAAILPTEQRLESWIAVWDLLNQIEKPIIAAVEGRALGAGFELALSCDLVVAGQSASFALTEVGFGLIPAGGGTQRLVRQIGKTQAMRLILTGDILLAPEALALGVISHCVDDGAALDHAIEVAQHLSQQPQSALHAAKILIRDGRDVSLNQGLELEKAALRKISGTTEQLQNSAQFATKKTKTVPKIINN